MNGLNHLIGGPVAGQCHDTSTLLEEGHSLFHGKLEGSDNE